MNVRATRGGLGTEDTKSGRVELRTTAKEKALLVAAAAEEHLDVTAFVLRAVIPAAREVVERSNRVELSPRDSARVLQLLENPPEPNRRLRRAADALAASRFVAERRRRGSARRSKKPSKTPSADATEASDPTPRGTTHTVRHSRRRVS